MKSSIFITAGLLAGHAMAVMIPSPFGKLDKEHGIIWPSSVAARDAKSPKKAKGACKPKAQPTPTPTVCNDAPVRAMRKPAHSANASSFCSWYIEPYTYVTAYDYVTIPASSTGTLIGSTTTTTSTSTVTLTASTTATALCPLSPPPPSDSPPICDFYAYGSISYLIAQPNKGLTADECHAACLANPNCRSYQWADVTPSEDLTSTNCNLWTADVSTVTHRGFFADPTKTFRFFERDCPEFSPAGCGADAGGEAPAGKRDVAGNGKTCDPNASNPDDMDGVPDYLTKYQESQIMSACTCLITTVPPTLTLGVIETVTVMSSATVGSSVPL
jgi:hypothetical protein